MSSLSDTTETEESAIQVPIYVHLPPIEATGNRRQLLLTVDVQRSANDRTEIGVVWDEISLPQPYQPAPLLPRASFPVLPGVQVFVPRNALFSPVFLVVSQIDRFRLPARLLIAVSITPSAEDHENTVSVEIDARYLPEQRRGRVRLDLIQALRNSAPELTFHYDDAAVLLRTLQQLSQSTSRGEPAPEPELAPHGNAEPDSETEVEALLF